MSGYPPMGPVMTENGSEHGEFFDRAAMGDEPA